MKAVFKKFGLLEKGTKNKSNGDNKTKSTSK